MTRLIVVVPTSRAVCLAVAVSLGLMTAPLIACTSAALDDLDRAQSTHPKLPVFDILKWDKSLDEIKGSYPGGVDVRVDKDETHYRLLASAFGHDALVTFCFRNGSQLEFLAIEFIQAGEQCDPRSGDYKRPSGEAARRIHKQVRTALDDRYGHPVRTRGTPGEGGALAFGREYGEHVRLDSTVIDRDQQHLVVWGSNVATEPNESHGDKALVAGLWRTPATSWVPRPIFDVKWGMGPGDVRDMYPGMTAILYFPDRATQAYDADAYIQGDVEIDFEFFKGRLVRLMISPERFAEIPSDASTREEKWAVWERWRDGVLGVLHERYGSPVRGHRGMFVDPKEDPPNAWQWETDSTRIVLVMAARFPILIYSELSSMSEVQAAELAIARKEEQRRKERF